MNGLIPGWKKMTMKMSSLTINNLIMWVEEAAREWIFENYESYDDFDEAFEDLQMDDSVTGNSSGRCAFHSDEIAHDIVWEEEFQRYIEDFGCELSSLINRGEETVFVYACYMALDYFLWNTLCDYFNELKGETE